MKNTFLCKFDSIVKINVRGRNINRFIKRIVKQKINIIKLIPISYKEVELIIYYKDYLILKKYKSIYEIKIIKKYGRLRLKELIKSNYIILLSILLGIVLISFLSRIIFDIQVIHSNKEIINLVTKELNNYGIKKYSFKKSYQSLEKIEDKILKDNKDKLDWIEIIENGTKYIIRVEERIIVKSDNKSNFQDVVTSKNAVITKIYAISGEKIVKPNTYVSKGTTVISGTMILPNEEKVLLHAEGKVYGEVWYKINVDYPYHHYTEKRTGKKRNNLYVSFLGKRISFNDYKTFSSRKKILFKNNLLPISLNFETQYETKKNDIIYTEDEALNKAIIVGKEKLKKENKKIESIKSVKVLKEDTDGKNIKVSLFISAIEDVTATKEITKSND